jgi:hypothetical protein
MLTNQDAKNLIDKVIGYSKLPECQADVTFAETVFIRFANNGITTSGYQLTQQVSITSVTAGKQSGNAVVNELSEDALRRGVQQAEDLARISKPDPEHVAPLGPQQYPALKNFDSFTSSARGDVMIPHVTRPVQRTSPQPASSPAPQRPPPPATRPGCSVSTPTRMQASPAPCATPAEQARAGPRRSPPV